MHRTRIHCLIGSALVPIAAAAPRRRRSPRQVLRPPSPAQVRRRRSKSRKRSCPRPRRRPPVSGTHARAEGRRHRRQGQEGRDKKDAKKEKKPKVLAKELFGKVDDRRRARPARHRLVLQGLPRGRRAARRHRPRLADDAPVAQPRLGPSQADQAREAARHATRRRRTAGRGCSSATSRSRAAARCSPGTRAIRSGSTPTSG